MRVKKQHFLVTPIIIITLLIFSNTNAQLTVDVELRPRFEYRHGFKTLFPNNTEAASFISQRTRLNSKYTNHKLQFYLSLQDVRVWGDVPQLNTADKNGLSLHQAWGKVLFTPNFDFKIGRQEIVYDDHRIFGNVDWAQQARSHDAAVLKFRSNRIKFDFGYAFNQNAESLTGNVLTTPNTYKSLQYAWVHKDWKDISVSVLFLNNGLQFTDDKNKNNNETRYSQTTGAHLRYLKNRLTLTLNTYYQFGNDIANNELNAYLLGFEANYSLSKKISVALGAEVQSGNDNNLTVNGKNKAFTPLYGTNHKFNGHMDYFYVGNHINNVGLTNLFAKAKVKIANSSFINVALHNFLATADISGIDSKELGTEIDLAYSYQFQKNINFKVGYSHMFASEGLEIVKDNFDDNSNYWGWLMVTIDPILFKTELKKEQL